MESDKLNNEWALVQYELPQDGFRFTIFHSSDAVANSKLIKGQFNNFKCGNSFWQAKILSVSGNKTVLENEMAVLEESRKSVETFKRKRTATHLPIVCKIPSPAWTNHTNVSINSNVNKQIPPMLFHQGTQTDYKLSEEGLTKISQQIELFATQLEQTKQMLTDIWTMVKEIPKKSDCNDTNSHLINSQINTNNEPILLFTNSSNEIVKLNHAGIDSNVTIETYDLNNESSNISYSNCSQMSTAVSDSSIYNFTTTGCQQSPSRTKSLKNTEAPVSNELQRNWNAIEIDEESDDVTIGSNGTRVSKKVLDTIKWSSHTNATRSILAACFSRDTLATHSLTGKPSPAFLVSSKPAKKQLNATVISDIVQFVSKKCQATETAVRAAITTKCADENKMMRQRKEKSRRKILQSMENSNKENGEVDKKTLPQNVTL